MNETHHFRARSILALCAGTSASAIGDLSSTQVTLSCNDGHSVIVAVDPAALTELASEVAAINSIGTALSCTLSQDSLAASSSTDSAKWTVYDYNPSGQAIRPRESPASMPATTSGNTTSFPFGDDVFTALLTTIDKELTGDLSGKTLSDTVSVSGSSTSFKYQHGDGCVYPANVRFYFASPSASGSSVGTPPAGFYTHFWWSNPANAQLLTGDQTPMSISAMMSDPTEWSDWNGQRGDSSPVVLEAFNEAIHKVQTVGLSFGGGCFFENGVTKTDGSETFSSSFSES